MLQFGLSGLDFVFGEGILESYLYSFSSESELVSLLCHLHFEVGELFIAAFNAVHLHHCNFAVAESIELLVSILAIFNDCSHTLI